MKKIKNRILITSMIANDVPKEGYSMRDILATLKGSNPAITDIDAKKFISNAVRDKWLRISCKGKDMLSDMDAKVVFKRDVLLDWLDMDILRHLFPKKGEFNKPGLYDGYFRHLVPSLSKMAMVLQRLVLVGDVKKYRVGSTFSYSWNHPATLDSFKEDAVPDPFKIKEEVVITPLKEVSVAIKEFNTNTLLIKAEDDIWQARPEKVEKTIFIYEMPRKHVPIPMTSLNLYSNSGIFPRTKKLSAIFDFKNSIVIDTKSLRNEYHTSNGHGILMMDEANKHYLATTIELSSIKTWMRLVVQE